MLIAGVMKMFQFDLCMLHESENIRISDLFLLIKVWKKQWYYSITIPKHYALSLKNLWLQNRRQNRWMSPSSALVFTGKVNTNNWLQISATEQWEWKAEYYKVF